MENKMTKRTISQRINARLREPDDAVFEDGKWRFWFVLVFGLSLGSAIGTAYIFPGAVGSLTLSMMVLLVWIFIGALHYSGSKDPRLARVVSALDSAALVFVIAHFCFVMGVLGHLLTVRGVESKYDREMEVYNAKAADVSKDNVEIAKSNEKVSADNLKAERLRNDAAYQLRRASEASGGRVSVGSQAASGAGVSPSLSTNAVQLKEPDRPKESSVAFLQGWEWWIRAANFGELILAAVTLIYIRNRSAKFNAGSYVAGSELLERRGEDFPAELDVRDRGDSRGPRFVTKRQKTTVATVAHDRESALRALRDHLGVIASYLPGRWFRADLIKGGVSIRLYERDGQRRESTIAETRQSNKLLDAVDRPDFRARLIDELKRQGFPIEKGGE
jgi:hypothetical protein